MEWNKYSAALVHMLVHRSTESLVIERLDIPATESPSVERDSLIFLDEDYRELEHDELSPVKITRTMGTLVLWFLQLPQGRVHIRVRHSWSEESLEDNLPDDLWSWEMSFTKGPSRGTRPSLYLIGRRSAHCWTSSFKRQGPPIKSVPSKAWLLRSGAA